MTSFPLPKIPGSLESIALGQLGSDLLGPAASYSGDWAIIQSFNDLTAFTTLTTSTISANGAAPGNIAAAVGVLKAGRVLYGRFSTIQLSAGVIVAYRANPA